MIPASKIIETRVEKRAFRIDEFVAAYGVGRSSTYKLIRAGKLKLTKVGGRSLIRVEDVEALLNGAES